MNKNIKQIEQLLNTIVNTERTKQWHEQASVFIGEKILYLHPFWWKVMPKSYWAKMPSFLPHILRRLK